VPKDNNGSTPVVGGMESRRRWGQGVGSKEKKEGGTNRRGGGGRKMKIPKRDMRQGENRRK